jgi:ATPase subunit of ABC transporter with duplicated ATPase domains
LSRRDFDVFRLGTAIAERHYSYDRPEPPGSTYARFLIAKSVFRSLSDQEDRMRTPGGTLAATNITKSYGADVVLDDVSVVVPPRSRIGVVGPNGSGKTTLLRVLAGLEPPDSGRVERRPRSLTVSYVPQEGDFRAEVPDWRLRKAAARVGLGADLKQPLSGGQLARAKLAVLLAAEPDVILLDEPTNNLDFDGLELLERFVAETPSALVIVSHDRTFLEQSVERIVEFGAETRKVREFAGSWDEYERLRGLARKREEDAYVRYAVVERGDFRLGPIDLELRHGDRLTVVGPNGSGKTTLLEALLGGLPLARGDRRVGPGVRLGELEQRRSEFAGPESLLETFCERSGLPAGEALTLLAKFALGADDVLRPSASLSPGERTRAGLALLSTQGVNALVLDEPTNHLDLEAIEELEAALDGYEGAIVLVTHDRRLLERFEPTQRLELLA